jgi:DNA-binding transcriptional regulator GbsR (MarR family)
MTETATLKRPLKGARALVLQTLVRFSNDNVSCLSYDEISHLSDYCPNTVMSAVRQLEDECFIRVEKRLGERRNTYRILKNPWSGVC